MSADDSTEQPHDDTPDVAGDAPAGKDTKAAKARKPAKAKAASKAKADAGAAAKEPAAKKPAARKKAAAKAEQPADAGVGEAEAGETEQGETEAEQGGEQAAPVAATAPAKRRKAATPVEPQESAAPARRSRAKAAPAAPRRRVVRAHARYVRTSARKARIVCVHLRGKSVQEARAILAFTPRKVARDWSKLLESAVANAESNHELLEDDLVIREAYADEGPTIKRFRPRAMGRATPIRKRTSHLTITLSPRPEPGTQSKHR